MPIKKGVRKKAQRKHKLTLWHKIKKLLLYIVICLKGNIKHYNKLLLFLQSKDCKLALICTHNRPTELN